MADDDLFTPTVVARPAVTRPPLRHGSLFLPAFLGGPLALLHLAHLSARRLHEPRKRRLLVVAFGLGGLVLALVVAGLAVRQGAQPRVLRYIMQGAGGLAFLAVGPVLEPGQRRYELGGGEYEKVGVGRGLAVCLGWGVVEAVLLTVVLSVAR